MDEAEIMKRLDNLEALEAVQKSHVEIIIRIPVGAILSQTNDDIGESVGVWVEEELDRVYPDEKKPETVIGDNVSIQLITNPE